MLITVSNYLVSVEVYLLCCRSSYDED